VIRRRTRFQINFGILGKCPGTTYSSELHSKNPLKGNIDAIKPY
jgi:hypothetical protein